MRKAAACVLRRKQESTLHLLLNAQSISGKYLSESSLQGNYSPKIGIEETKEILVNYLRRKDRDLNRLLRYAELLKCGDVMKTYLEVLV